MPFTRCAPCVRKIDVGLPGNVVFTRHLVEIKIKERLGHGNFLSRAKPCLICPAFSPMAHKVPRTSFPTSALPGLRHGALTPSFRRVRIAEPAVWILPKPSGHNLAFGMEDLMTAYRAF